jgi:tetratricopeptide (TPR) repeat protein
MKRSKSHPILIALLSIALLSSPSANAEESAWMNSYSLEASAKYAEALAAIDKVAANGSEAELKTLRRGWLYYLQGNYNESIREYRYAIERNRQSVDAQLGVTLPLLAQKRWREAEQHAQSSLSLAPNNYTGLLRLTLAQEGQRDWATMAKTSTTMVSLYPSDSSAYVYLARAYAWQGKRKEAVAAYSSVLARYPGHQEATNYIDKK